MKQSPIALAVFRIVLFAHLASFTLTAYDLVWFAGLPSGLRVIPPLAGWYAALPLTPQVVQMGRAALVGTSLLACVGWRTRWTAALAAMLALFMLGVPQLYGGKLDHYHHLVWFAAILAVSPCADALAIDARGQSVPVPSTAYGLPLMFIWLLLGLIYFFPGVSKAAMLPAWIAPDNLRFHLYQKWAGMGGFTPLIPIDRWPIALTLAATLTIVWELSAIWLFLHPRLRLIGAGLAILFHLSTWAIMAISFESLILCYVGLLAGAVAARLMPHGTVERASRRAPLIMGSLLTLGVLAAGLTGLDSWPLAVYPRFNYLPGPTMTVIDVTGVDRQEQPLALHLDQLRDRLYDGRWRAIQDRALRLSGEDQRRWSAAMIALIQRDHPNVAAITLTAVMRDVRPCHVRCTAHECAHASHSK